MTLQESLHQIEKLFPNAPPSDLKTIAVIGCCDEHDAGFQWYREHSWKDLRKEITDNGGDITKGLDVFEFGSLHPVAFHYFLPGLLTGVGDAVMAQSRAEEAVLDSSYWHAWLNHVVLPSKQCRNSFIADKLPSFHEEERSAIREFLSALAACLEGWDSKQQAEIDKAIKEVWK